MINSLDIYNEANTLVNLCGTRDTLKIAQEIGIKVGFSHEFNDLLGLYTYKWKHRIILLNDKLDEYMLQMVCGHELGHDARHREYAKSDGLKEFVLFNMTDRTEYEANAFCSHILLDDKEVCSLAHQGYDVIQMSKICCTNVNLMLIKLQEMNAIGYDYRIPFNADNRFFRKITT